MGYFLFSNHFLVLAETLDNIFNNRYSRNYLHYQSEVSELQMSITAKEDINKLPRADLWIISADEPDHLVPWINEWCVKNKQAYINSGYVNDIAVFGLFYILGKTGCYACSSSIGNFPEKSDGLIYEACAAINNNFKVATFPPVNALSAAICVNDALKFLGGGGIW
ncbi:ThiF family adenylyltransferase [Bartonella vinsonii]|uniref:ThiF family adenylyltransferase n=1 Tax=Bartonella vinsonii TaxID=33047 RepID=UPI001F1B2BAD|nr:ThiF family adenylyltransferase [Bartonella vinsonii]